MRQKQVFAKCFNAKSGKTFERIGCFHKGYICATISIIAVEKEKTDAYIHFMEEKQIKFHMIGIGGISMSALAKILIKYRFVVTGTDAEENDNVKELEKMGIDFVQGHCPCFVQEADVIVYSGAIANDDPDLTLARKLKKLVLSRAQLLGLVCRSYKTIAVCGSHGKSTTSALIAKMLNDCGVNASMHLGGISKDFGSNLFLTDGQWMVTEACEYKESFLSLYPDIIVVTNEKPDHLDYFKKKENYFSAYQKFARNLKKGGKLIVNKDDVMSKSLVCKDKSTISVKGEGDLTAKNIKLKKGKPKFEVWGSNKKFGVIKSPMFGKFNIYNIMCALAVGMKFNLPFKQMKRSIENFKGLKRREEFVCKCNGGKVYHDYAHHPDEIVATISSFKRLPHKRLYVVFQPHTYSRTQAFMEEFAKSFVLADKVFLLPIYPAREKEISGVSSQVLASKIVEHGKEAEVLDDFQSACEKMISTISKNDILLILGAGDIEKLAEMLKKI